MADNKETNSSKKGGLKKLLQSRKMRHGSLAVGITVIAVAVVILICSILEDDAVALVPGVPLPLAAKESVPSF